MRLFALLLLSAATLTAHATAFDTITFSFPNISFTEYPGAPPAPILGVDYSTTLPASPTPVGSPFPGSAGPGFFYNTDGLPFSQQPFSPPGTTFFFGPGSVFFVPTADINFPPGAFHRFSLLSAPALYTGPDTSPTLLPGTYQADLLVPVFGVVRVPGTITIAPQTPPTSAVPEPTSLVLAISGTLALLGADRLRRAKTAKV